MERKPFIDKELILHPNMVGDDYRWRLFEEDEGLWTLVYEEFTDGKWVKSHSAPTFAEDMLPYLAKMFLDASKKVE